MALKLTPVARTLVRRIYGSMALFAILVLSISRFVDYHHANHLLIWALAVFATLPIAAVVVSVGLYLRSEVDEFVRWKTMCALLWASGITLVITTLLGLLESLGAVEAIPSIYVVVLFAVLFGIFQGNLLGRDEAAE